MAFHDVVLPARLAFGSSGGVERRTEIVTLASGAERRSSPWAPGRRRFLIGAGVRSLDDIAALTAFFEARFGRLYAFRFKDFSDCKSCLPSKAPSSLDQPLGTGNGLIKTFALIKRYGNGGLTYDRAITKPVAGSVSIAADGVELPASGFSVNALTGVVTFAAAPPDGAAITAGYSFHTPVRFDTDRLDVSLEGFEAGRLVAAPLIEVQV